MFGTAYQIGFSGGGAAVPTIPERTRFVNANALADLPAATQDGDQSMVIGGVLTGMTFENVAGVQTYRGQHEKPMRTTIYGAAQRDVIGALLPVTELFWFGLTQADGANDPGWYNIDPDGIQTGPHMIAGGGGASVTPEQTMFLTAKPANAVGNDGDQAFITGGVMMSMIFSKGAGVWTYVGQSSQPMRTTVFAPADRTTIAAELPVGSTFWYRLLVIDGMNAVGLYSIDDSGIQSGPF